MNDVVNSHTPSSASNSLDLEPEKALLIGSFCLVGQVRIQIRALALKRPILSYLGWREKAVLGREDGTRGRR
jgi:hypothetical protein